MQDIKTTPKTAVITKVGKMEKTDKNGKPFKFDSVKVGLIFDFDPDVWYNGFLFPNQADKIREGLQLSIEVYDNVGSNGVTYKNFRIPKKASAEAGAIAELKTILEDITKRVQVLENAGSKTKSVSPNGPETPPVEAFNDENDGGEPDPSDFDF